jgi:hypothetical protein
LIFIEKNSFDFRVGSGDRLKRDRGRLFGGIPFLVLRNGSRRFLFIE